MIEQIQQPKYILKYWVQEKRDFSKPILKHSVFYTEEELIKMVRTLYKNYFIYEVGGMYKSKEYFDKMFAEEKITKEKEEYLKLKEKFENGKG